MEGYHSVYRVISTLLFHFTKRKFQSDATRAARVSAINSLVISTTRLYRTIASLPMLMFKQDQRLSRFSTQRYLPHSLRVSATQTHSYNGGWQHLVLYSYYIPRT